MLSKWYELKDEAIKLRHKGKSMRYVEIKLGIPRSTLSGWFKNVVLTKKQLKVLHTKYYFALVRARKEAVKWHNLQKENRLAKAREEANLVLSRINTHDKSILETCLAMIYLGEGSKTNLTSLGNTNPLILKFFIKSVEILFDIHNVDLKCDLHLRSDQDGKKMVLYWSKELNISKDKFIVMKDKRLIKSKTYTNYKGVCVVRCGKIAIQRRIIYLGEEYCKRIINEDT
jgi:hypothetical protein